MSLEVEAGDCIKLVIQFLKENNLLQTLRVLQEESQVTLNTVEDVDKFYMDIINGRWDAVLETTANLRLPQEKLMDLFEQVVLELAELRELDAARSILRTTPAMAAMKKEHPERYLRLEHILQRTYFDYAEAYPGGSNKERRRQQIAQSLKSDVFVVPPSRLLALISQALKWQQHQGLLPKGTRFDLFRGSAPVTAVEDEKMPETNSKVIKFGKKSHPEVARFSPDGQYLVSGSSDGFVEVWDFDTGKLAKELKYQAEDDFMMHEDAVLSLTFSRDGELLASADSKGMIKVWRLKTGSCVRRFPTAHTGGVTSLEFSRDGTQLLSASFDQTIRIHGLKSGRMLKEFRGHKSFVHAASYTEDNAHVVSASADGFLKVWDARTTDCVRTFKPNPTSAAAPSVLGLVRLAPRFPDRLLVCSRSNALRTLSLEGQVIQAFPIPAACDIVNFAASPKGNFVYAVGEDHVLYCFAADTAKMEQAIKLHEKDVLGLAHHPHRNIFASYSSDGSMKIWRSGSAAASAPAPMSLSDLGVSVGAASSAASSST